MAKLVKELEFEGFKITITVESNQQGGISVESVPVEISQPSTEGNITQKQIKYIWFLLKSKNVPNKKLAEIIKQEFNKKLLNELSQDETKQLINILRG